MNGSCTKIDFGWKSSRRKQHGPTFLISIINYHWHTALSRNLKHCFQIYLTLIYAGFHSSDLLPCFSTETKEKVCILMKLSSLRNSLRHQHDCRVVVQGPQNRRRYSCENHELIAIFWPIEDLH